MRLRELFESKNLTSIGVCFGRWNPPHKGHKAAWEIASQNDVWFVGTNQNTQDADNPLPYEIKLKAMAAIWPEVAGHVIPEQNLFTLVTEIYKTYGENVILKVATDEDWLTKSLIKYNGVEGAHGKYKFQTIEQAPTPRLSSATALRAAVRAGDREAFSEAAGVSADTDIDGTPFFDLVAHYLLQYPEKVKKVKKLSETKKKSKLSKSATMAMPNFRSWPELDNNNNPYRAFRFGQHMAAAPRENDIPLSGPIGTQFVTSSYTDVEDKIIDAAAKTMGVKHIKHGGKGSQELPDVNSVSPVAKPKKNKYGI